MLTKQSWVCWSFFESTRQPFVPFSYQVVKSTSQKASFGHIGTKIQSRYASSIPLITYSTYEFVFPSQRKVYLDFIRTSTMEHFCKNSEQHLAVNYFRKKNLIVDVGLGSKYVPAVDALTNKTTFLVIIVWESAEESNVSNIVLEVPTMLKNYWNRGKFAFYE